jgi:hypothetical protein
VAFYSQLSGGSSSEGLFIGTAGSVQAIALRSTTAPGGGIYSILSNNSISPLLNGSGQVAFIAGLSGSTSTQGIFVGTPGSLQSIARNNTAAPAGGNFLGFNSAVLNGSGQVAFRANLTSSTSNEGLFIGTAGSVQTVALVGTLAPAGGRFDGFFDSPVLNGSGQVAFRSALTGGTSTQGLFAGTPGSLQAIVLQGQVIDCRTVNAITFASGSGGQDGQGVSFNDSGLLVYGLSFTDGASGIYTTQLAPVPEPTTVLGVSVAGLALAGLVRRRRMIPLTNNGLTDVKKDRDQA